MCLTSLASRVHLVMGYNVIATAPAQLEPWMASSASWFIGTLLISLWFIVQAGSNSEGRSYDLHYRVWPLCTLWIACGPTAIIQLLRTASPDTSVFFTECIWFSLWTGISFASLNHQMLSDWLATRLRHAERTSLPIFLTCLTSACAAIYFFFQTRYYFDSFLLGYNDFGHFAIRVINSSRGNGLLRESPVLPTFWDHFNPGLLLLVPIWRIWPSENLFFALQAISLTSSSLIVFAIARRLGHSHWASMAWSIAWLAQPTLGQINIAYTYGWHPISLAIPGLLLAIWLTLRGQYAWASVAACLAMSMEEGVIVIVGLCLASMAGQVYLTNRFGRADPCWEKLTSVWPWLVSSCVCAVGFVAVYQLSGLADFQTGRFARLGTTASEIILSPISKPTLFWGEVGRWESFGFLMALLIPCYLPTLCFGWKWLIPTLLPLGVLLAWDHAPAKSITFQYSSTLLPLFWCATMSGSIIRQTSLSSAIGAVTTCLTLSTFLGLLPYSSPNLLDVVGRTYGTTDARKTGSEDNRWLTEQLQQISQDGGPVLATGRLAAHLISNGDIETVGQFLERIDAYTGLPTYGTMPLQHFHWIALDTMETFQQSQQQTLALEEMAYEQGFTLHAQEHSVVILRRN